MVTISPLLNEGLGNSSCAAEHVPGGLTIALEPVLELRQTARFVVGHIPGAALIELGSLHARASGLAGEPITVMCGHAKRAATAASILEGAGGTASVFLGSARGWSRAVGRPLATGG